MRTLSTFIVTLALCLYFSSSLQAAKVDLGSLKRRSDNDVRKLARTLSTFTSPEVLRHNMILGFLKFDVGYEQTIYHMASDIDKIFTRRSDVDRTTFLPFLQARMGLPWGLDIEETFLIPGIIDKMAVWSTSLRWVPLFLKDDKYYVTPALRQSHTFTDFSQYESHTWTTDLIISSKKLGGVPLYLGASFVQILGEFNKRVIRVTSKEKEPEISTAKFFLGADYKFKLTEKFEAAIGAEIAFMSGGEAYGFRGAIQF